MRVTGKTPDRVKKIYIQGSQNFSTFHFDDSQGPPKDGISFHVQGSSDAGASVAPGAAVSFSPPAKRAPSRPSIYPRKRKESVAALGDDDDDFVSVPPRPSASSSKATRVAVRKIKKSKSSIAGPKHPEGVQNLPKRTNPNYKCAPNKVVEAIKILTDPQKMKIRNYPFGPLLDLKLKGLENTKLLVFLMDRLDRLDPDTLTLNIGNGKHLKITRHSIQSVLGLPNRGKHIVSPDRYKQKEALSNLKKKLGIDPGVDVKVQDLIKWLENKDTDTFSVRCFSLILLGKLLIPGTSDFITGKEAALTEDMETLCLVNWASVIFDDIVVAANLWRSKKKSCTNPSMHGCLIFLLVYYLDNLLGKHSTDPTLTPRIAHITKQQLLDLIEEDKQVVDGVETFGALPLRSQEGTCYMEHPSSSTYDPYGTQAADIPSTPYLSPPALFPSMLHHLAGCFNRFSAEEQFLAKKALRRCDEEVVKLTSQISSTQMLAIEEIRRILHDGQSRTTPPPPPDGRGTTIPVTDLSPPRATHSARNMEALPHRQPPSSNVADDPNVVLHEGHNIETGTHDTDAISFTQVVEGDGFNKLSCSQQAAFMDEFFGNPDIHQSPGNSPHESPYDSPHEILTNGVCKTCHDIDEMFQMDEELPNEKGDADTSATDEATVDEGNEPFGLRPQVDADATGKMASLRTPHIFRPLRDILPDPSFQGLHSEPQSSPLPPPVFDKTPNLHPDSLTPSVDGTERVTQLWEVSQQLRDAGLQNIAACNKVPYLSSPVFDETPKHLTHGTKNVAHQLESLQSMFDRDESVVCVKNTTTKISRPKVSSLSCKLSTSRNSQNKVVHSRLVFHGTQPPITSRRNKHLSPNLLSPFKCRPNKEVCPIPLDSAIALRDIVICDRSLMEVPLISNVSLGVCSRGEALASSFKDNASTLVEIMNFFTECLRHDEKLLSPQCRGYRLFLSWTFGSLLNCEDHVPGQVYDSCMAVQLLSEHLNGVDPKQIKLILWTYHHSNHFSVYCVNRVNTRIDVLDSIDWSKNGGSFEQRNDPWGYMSIKRLSNAFQTVVGKEFEDFSNWPIWSKEVPRQLPLGNSCASFTQKFLRHYDGEESQLRCSIEPTKENQYRAEELSYLIFHELNEIRPLPESLEKFRPMINHM